MQSRLVLLLLLIGWLVEEQRQYAERNAALVSDELRYKLPAIETRGAGRHGASERAAAVAGTTCGARGIRALPRGRKWRLSNRWRSCRSDTGHSLRRRRSSCVRLALIEQRPVERDRVEHLDAAQVRLAVEAASRVKPPASRTKCTPTPSHEHWRTAHKRQVAEAQLVHVHVQVHVRVQVRSRYRRRARSRRRRCRRARHWCRSAARAEKLQCRRRRRAIERLRRSARTRAMLRALHRRGGARRRRRATSGRVPNGGHSGECRRGQRERRCGRETARDAGGRSGEWGAQRADAGLHRLRRCTATHWHGGAFAMHLLSPVFARAVVPRQPTIQLRNVHFDRFELQHRYETTFPHVCLSIMFGLVFYARKATNMSTQREIRTNWLPS